jgi:hypothetical protein
VLLQLLTRWSGRITEKLPVDGGSNNFPNICIRRCINSRAIRLHNVALPLATTRRIERNLDNSDRHSLCRKHKETLCWPFLKQ